MKSQRLHAFGLAAHPFSTTMPGATLSMGGVAATYLPRYPGRTVEAIFSDVSG